ncbi:DUF3180 family protein [Mycetocola reblochoni]|uniref:Secreted protein n=2 Tax=Mycetocola reblochoni TaxID=331618 RepID=A0A1R4I7F8_9MICO|nr:DUF3180 family protein [Mycetocola reblochoni]RLP68910.1 DUF3180 family protein [Mycetocola reblochoni]SJN15626.1 secreted protein [Mycetocola reblochoni REB411]
MKRSAPGTLAVLVLVGAALAYLGERLLLQLGAAMFVPPLTLPLTLVTVAAVLLIAAVPIRRSVTGASRRRVEPLRAARVALLAVASAHAAALLTGASAGVVAYMLLRTVLPAVGSVWLAVGALAAAIVLLASAVVAESLCTLPKDDDDDDPSGVPEAS